MEAFWIFNYWNIKVHDHSILIASNEHALQGLVRICIYFLMRHKRGHVDEIPGPSLTNILQ